MSGAACLRKTGYVIPQRNNLRLYYDFIGDTATDKSTYGNNGTLVASPTFADTIYGRAIALDGSSQYVSIPSAANLNVYNGSTLSAIIKTTRTTPGSIIRQSTGVGLDCHTIVASWTSLDATAIGKLVADQKITSTNWGTGIKSTTTITDDAYKLVTSTFDGSKIRVYVNGVLESTGPAFTPYNYGSSAWRIGSYMTAGVEMFLGQILHPMIYGVCLSDAEVLQLKRALMGA